MFVGYSDKGQGALDGTGIGNKGGGNGNQKYESSYQRPPTPPSPPGGSGKDNMSWDKIYQKCIESGTSGTLDSGSGTKGTLETLARILLGAIPLVFSGLSYLYWISVTGENDKNAKDNLKLSLRYYVERMGFRWEEWRVFSNGGVDIGEGGLIKVFEDCHVLGKNMEDGDKDKNYAQYLEKLRKEAEKEKDTKDKHSLLKLNILCSGYFRSLHTIDSIRDPRPRTPNTVREILYWLTSLPYCPIYRTLVPKVQEMFRRVGTGGKVVFYGANYSGKLEVSDENCGSYLLGAGLVAPLVLLGIQDTIECRVGKDERTTGQSVGEEKNYKLKNYDSNVSIHDLYANMQFYFSYPLSETQSYYLLQDCLVALYYQLYFLRLQCESGNSGDIWWSYCKYGEGVMCDDEGGVGGKGCTSWICPVGNKSEHEKNNSNPCGTNASNPSPLQAFLTDCLKGFTCDRVMDKDSGKKYQENLKQLRNSSSSTDNKAYEGAYPGFLDHRNHLPVGQECAVPMGFSGSFRLGGPASGSKDGMIGLGIYGVLRYYTHWSVSDCSLYQITRCICSLTRRVPRSVGTIYGFFYGLVDACNSDKTGGKTNFKPKLEDELKCCPGWRDPKGLMEAVMEWKGDQNDTDHQNNGNHAKASLFSLTQCTGGKTPGSTPTCGKYLWPLGGNLYNSMAPEFTETYLSWIVHLTYQLQSGLESLLKEFRNINCQEAGCKDSKGGKGQCDCDKQGCTKGTHGVKSDSGTNKDGCCCESVVHCVGVHGLFYRFGFSYFGLGMLTGKDDKNGGPKGTRKCTQFYQQLEAVIGGELFDNLFTQIRKFIYTTGALFGVYIGVYWLAVLGYLLWSMTVNLDLVHIQSHWRSPRSYLVPLQRLLADNKVKGFCRMGYFQEANGDRLLSQGVSDVYL